MANLGIRHWTEPQFFKPILPPFQRLSIPKAFLKHLVDEMCEEGVGEATLRNHQCAQKSWRVKVKGFCFTKGWNDFFRDNDLGLGDFLVFTYKGSMVFDVKIFDRSCCEKKYHYPPATPVKMETHKHPPATLVKMETQKHQERDHNQSGDKEIKINNLSNGRFRTLPCNGSKNNDQIRIGTHNPFFEISLRPYYFKERRLVIPRHFARLIGLMGKSFITTLRDGNGRSWVVELKYNSKRTLHLLGDWAEISSVNGLKVGDTCKFELIRRGKLQVMEFRIV
ncbi:B3 domain-containing protein REM8-like isoform X1 [Macadamia integrifolia]|uniref:B3 domain-containing protein REM8-like isoform X1 n=1 Tax=Macadamia integrifolia TaxID=60698 RepID=UPI001C4EB1CF|nr:B3 domain-containing protein REM8-like isoform X1 [Macadamia integrifolia]